MKFNKVIIFIILALVLAFNVTTQAYAKVTSSEVTCKAGEQITIEFEYKNVVGFQGEMIFSEPNAVKNIDKIEITGFSENNITFDPDTNVFLAVRLSTNKIANCTVSITLTVDENFTEKENFTFSLEYIVAQGEIESEEGTDSVVVNVSPSEINLNELQRLIRLAESKSEKDYTVGSWSVLKSALTEAYSALGSNDQTIVNNAVAKLRSALKGLESLNYDYTALNALIQRAEDLNKDEYTSTSWAKLEAALNGAKEALLMKDQAAIDDATAKLADAIVTLVKLNNSDITELLSVIKEAEDLDSSHYTAESWAKLSATLHMAKKYCQTTMDQEIIDAYTLALRTAIDALVPVEASKTVDYTILNLYISVAKSLNESEYTSASWANLESALENGIQALSSKDQSVVNSATVALRKAIYNLVKKSADPNAPSTVDYSKLIAKIEEAEALDSNKYTEDSWANLLNKLADGTRALLSDSQAVVDAATDALDQAIKSLALKTDAPVVTVDYSLLNSYISVAESLRESDYTADSWAKLEEALAIAKSALSSDDQAVVNDAVNKLREAINGLVKKSSNPEAPNPVDYSKLIAKMEEVDALDRNKYTADSWTNLLNKVNAGIYALLSDDQSVVDAATDAIDKAIKALVIRPQVNVDYTALRLQISIAELLDENKYTEESWSVLSDALAKAKSALQSNDQSVVDTAASNLEVAINALEKKQSSGGNAVDYTKLQAAIDVATMLSKDDYTPDSWEAMVEALTIAKAALKSTEQAFVDSAEQDLKAAIEALVLAENEKSSRWWIWLIAGAVVVLAGVACSAWYIARRRRINDNTPWVDYYIEDDN